MSIHFTLSLLCVQAKDMVCLVNKFAAKVEEKKGALSEDEVSWSLDSDPPHTL